MNADDFKAWRKEMELSQSAAAKELGLSVDTLTNYEAGVRRDTGKPVLIPRYIALACAALKAGLKPLGQPL